jgi:hypothetical protein
LSINASGVDCFSTHCFLNVNVAFFGRASIRFKNCLLVASSIMSDVFSRVKGAQEKEDEMRWLKNQYYSTRI